MVVRMRHTRSHTKNRRSHHALEGARLSETEAGVKHPRHKALLDGTPYRGRSVGKPATAPAKKAAPAAEEAAPTPAPTAADKDVPKEAVASKKPVEKKIKK